jgi:hypothetical protein
VASKFDRNDARESPDLPPISPVSCVGNWAEGIMAKGSSPAAWIAVGAALLVSEIVVGPPIGSARADDSCATAPGTAPPGGQHWYYRTDRVKNRKCWYLHATVPSNAAAEPTGAPSEAAPPESLLPAATAQSPTEAAPHAANVPSAPWPAAGTANAPSEGDSTEPAPHITVLTVKRVTAPFNGTPSASETAAPEQAGEPPVPLISPGDANVPAVAETTPAPTAPDAVHDAPAPADPAASDAPGTQSAHLFLLLALALGIAAALVALIGKMAGLMRKPRLSVHPDDAWRSYRIALRRTEETTIDDEDAPLLAPRETDGPSDLDAQEWIEQAPPAQADFPARRPRVRGQSEQTGPSLKDIETALRILRQARRSITRM